MRTTGMSPSESAPPFDPSLAAFFQVVPPADIVPSAIPAVRDAQNAVGTLEGTLSANPGFTHHEHLINGPYGQVPVSFFTPKTATPYEVQTNNKRPAIFFLHPGGFIFGNRYTMLADPLRWAKECNALLVTVEYRHAPEHPFPVPHDDSWAALVWLFSNAASMGVDADRVVVAGMSAGANLAASLALRAREEGEKKNGVKIAGLVMDAAMLDDREYKRPGHSHNQFAKYGTWNLQSNVTAWDAYLSPSQSVAQLQSPSSRSRRGGKNVSSLAAPARAESLRGLPPTYISVGSAEIFRDENIDFAKKMYGDGGKVELHVWHGGYHCFDALMPDVEVSKRSIETRARWVKGVIEKGAARKDEKAKL